MKRIMILPVLMVSLFGLHAAGRRPAPEPFTFVQMGDPQLGMGGYGHDTLMFRTAVKKINELNPDLVFICGDMVGKRDEASFAGFNSLRAGLTVPSYCTPGNHDVGAAPTKESLELYRKAMGGSDYFSLEHKGFTFVVANSQLWKAPVAEESEKHDAWLLTVLQQAKKKKSPVIMVFHYPLFIKTPDEGDDYFNLPPAKRAELLALFTSHGVAAVLTGHTHYVLINEYKGIPLVSGEVTSKDIQDGLLGFRVWSVDVTGGISHRPVHIE